ncbi:SDR family oxidoreductase [Aquibacillus koreensis]|uniref:SDR family oxidoreductase n=1 Tax=Aquibacillus koreensis TaxID=279446 RepID=A0A9X4AJ90_9BACI|nr:SDR family oxidoreductase [Aquibacillus koreensis]MCT2535749.1 SDR family oxidoreductase [Aquibacillus koreensis]MDC3420205.1 SDR family oxidoreductase [Aquibacillus koreensis]
METVIVTGAGNGIGRAVAMAYAEAGAQVVVADVDEQAGRKTVKQIQTDLNGNAVFVQADVRKPEDIVNLMDKAINHFGHIHVLINNAGVSRFTSIFDITVDEWDDVINTNLRGAFLCAREAAKHMRTNKDGGSIVNIASTRASMSEANSEAYAATKGGISSLTHALAMSLQEEHITVNAISPGWIETTNYDSLREIDHDQHPSKRVGTPSDIASACLFLTDPKNNFINGENLVIDGGMTRKMMYEH